MHSRKQSQHKYKQYNNFTIFKALPYDKMKARNHIFQIIKIPKANDDSPLRDRNTHLWYLKWSNPKYAIAEVIAQEFLRLLMPQCDYPKTRIIENQQNQLGIISKEIPNHCDFNPREDKFSEENFGEMLVVALFLNELDLRNDNLKYDLFRNLVKVDGNWCFGKTRKTKNEKFIGKHDITAEDLQTLPYPKNYLPYNWLDFIHKGKYTQKPKLLYADLANNPRFRHGVNRGILKCLTFNALFFNLLRISYIEGRHAKIAEIFIEELLSRQQQLAAAVRQNLDFTCYLHSEQSATDFAEHLEQVKFFVTQGKNYLSEGAEENLREISKKYQALAPKSTLTNHCLWQKTAPKSQPTETETKDSSPSLPPNDKGNLTYG